MNIFDTDQSFDNNWKTLIDNIDNYANSKYSRWNAISLLCYFLQQYKLTYNADFVFTLSKNGPIKSKETKDMGRIFKYFDKGRYKNLPEEQKPIYKEQLVNILKDYVKWVFQVKCKKQNLSITGTGLLTLPGVINEFLQWRQKNKLLPSRNTLIPEKFIQEMQAKYPNLFNKHQIKFLEDLNILIDYISVYNLSDSEENKFIEESRSAKILPDYGKINLGGK